MSIKTLALYFFAGLVTACATPTAQPSVAPAPLAVTIPAPTPTPRVESSPVITTRPFTVQQRVALRDLPGEGRAPVALALNGDKLYALNNNSKNIAIIQNDRVVKFIPLNTRPAALAADLAQNRLYVASGEDKTVSLIANDQVALTQPMGETVRALLFFEGRLYAGLDTKNGILVLDPATLQIQARIDIPNIFSVMALSGDPVHHRLYANVYDKTAVIDSTTFRVLSTIETKGSYETLLAFPHADNVLIGIYDSQAQAQQLTAFDWQTGKPTGRVKLGGDAREAVLTADGTRAYVANSFTNDVSVIDPRALTSLATIPVGSRPWSVALDERARRLYVGNYDGDSITVVNLDTNQVTTTIPLGMIVTALAADERTSRVYVANASTDSVFVVEGARVVKEISVGRHPIDLVRDAQSNRLLVANQADMTLSIIDETTFAVRATQPITRFVTTVEADPTRARVFVNDVILDYNTFAPMGRLTTNGFTIGSVIAPGLVRVNPNTNRIYANGSNGTPGSNGRWVTYSVDGDTLKQRGVLFTTGNTTAFAIDPDTNRVFLASTHPLAYTNQLTVFDANDAAIRALPMPARTTGMVFNPQTHHLFLAHAASYVPYGARPVAADNTIQVLDTDSLGEVARFALDSPGKLTRLGNTIYVASSDGFLSVIQDATVPTPPSPTPPITSTPYPSLTPTATPSRTPTLARSVITATPLPACAISPGAAASTRWNAQIATRLGCPAAPEQRINFATQAFERGAMFWREDAKQIYVIFSDKTWASFADTWNPGLADDSCPSVNVGGVKPKRGFGKVWCEQSGVRAKIGVGTSDEFGVYTAPVQGFARGTVFADSKNQVIVMYGDGRWE